MDNTLPIVIEVSGKAYATPSLISGVICVVWAYLGPNGPLWIIGILAVILGLSGISWAGIHHTLIGEIAGKELAGV